MLRARFALVVSVLVLTSGVARASELLVNGAASAAVAQGLPVSVTLSGTPGNAAWLIADTGPGPTVVFGHEVPVTVDAGTLVFFLGAIPGSGTLAFGGDVPFDLGLAGTTVYMVATVVNGPIPGGLDWSEGAQLHITERNQQLAGNPLASYPDFEYVRAFNANTPVTMTVDPALHPEVAGDTADVYVTAKRTRAQWLGDGTLVDVNGGPRTVVLSGQSLIANETLLATAGQLSAAAGLGLGVGYDVVVDLDQDGTWNNADLIDGFSDEAGLYRVHDTTQPGPLAVTEAIYTGGTWLGQDLYYPSNIANLPGPRPLVVVSHGNGHNYQWYDHIGNHLASYGFIVMSHQNNTQAGVDAASLTTITNTDYLLANLAIISNGDLVGHLDDHRIMWIGHSRGGEGVARAYDRLLDGTSVPAEFTAADIKIISSIAPTDFLGPNSANPHGAPYHLWVGQADNDVSGCPVNEVTQSYHLHDRAEATRLSISLNGVGHGDFHDGGGSSVAFGPCLVGRPDTHTIMRGYVLPLAQHFLEGNIPSQDFFSRQWESFRPIGAPDFNPCVVANLQYRASGPGVRVLDDFQTNPSTALSSSGGAVSATVTIVAEGRLDDENTNFTTDALSFNGFTEGAPADTTKGLVFQFDGTADVSLQFDVPAAQKDVSGFAFLTFRTAQATRHPLTIAALQDSTFTVELRDGAGHTSQVNIGAWGGGIEEPYQRTGCGIGTGWGNEFETIRIRLTDLVHGTAGLDLTDLTSVTFRFGPTFSSPAFGRFGLDDLQFTGE
jgi:hypothetical protein